MSRRAWVIGAVAGVVVLAGAVAVPRLLPGCADEVTRVPAARSSSPFLGAAQREEQPDRDRDALVQSFATAPAPFGEVLGAVGYHYGQWARVGAFAQGIGVRTRDNPDFTMLDDTTLQPRWSVEVDTGRSAYDASDRRYLVATLANDAAPDLVAMNASTGERLWCSSLDGPRVQAGDPFATQLLADEDVAVLGPSAGREERIVRLSGRDGAQVWERTLDAGAGDFLGDLGNGRLLAGGTEQFRLSDTAEMERRPEGPALVALSGRDGRTIWTRNADAGSGVHVLGTDPTSGSVVIQEWSSTTRTMRLIVLDGEGNQKWFAVPARGAAFDATLRSGRILVRAGDRWSAYAMEDGNRLWTRTVPAQPQFLPYGFELAGVPLLKDDRVLIGGTTALHTLDLRTGAMTSARLPTDGISTTYWPYQVAVSAGLVAVATNTGAVVTRRE